MKETYFYHFVFLAILIIIYVIYSQIQKRRDKRNKSDENAEKVFEKLAKKPQEKKPSQRIEEEFGEAVNLVGISEPADIVSMLDKILDGKESDVVQEIAKALSLNWKVNLVKSKEIKRDANGKTTIAEVRVGNIPRYGTSRFESWPCTIVAYEGYNTNPNRFIAVIAHELCHYLLQSLRDRHKDEEKEERLTDIASIVCGFKSAVQSSRKSDVNGTTGYLADDEAAYVFRRYNELLELRREERKTQVNLYDGLLNEYSDKFRFIKHCKKLLDDKDTKIFEGDQEDINTCLSLVTQKQIDSISSLRRSLDKMRNNKRYPDPAIYEKQLEELRGLISSITLPPAEAISTLARYTG